MPQIRYVLARPPRPPKANARRHRFTDIRDTRKRMATSGSLAPPSFFVPS